jgi:hypothetical protein
MCGTLELLPLYVLLVSDVLMVVTQVRHPRREHQGGRAHRVRSPNGSCYIEWSIVITPNADVIDPLYAAHSHVIRASLPLDPLAVAPIECPPPRYATTVDTCSRPSSAPRLATTVTMDTPGYDSNDESIITVVVWSTKAVAPCLLRRNGAAHRPRTSDLTARMPMVQWSAFPCCVAAMIDDPTCI